MREGDLPRGPLLPPQRLLDLRAAAARAADGHPAPRRPLRREVRAPARQGRAADLDARDRHADELPLAGERPRAGELHRAGRPRLRRRRHSRPPPAADAPDGGGLRDAAAGVARGRRSARSRRTSSSTRSRSPAGTAPRRRACSRRRRRILRLPAEAPRDRGGPVPALTRQFRRFQAFVQCRIRPPSSPRIAHSFTESFPHSSPLRSRAQHIARGEALPRVTRTEVT